MAVGDGTRLFDRRLTLQVDTLRIAGLDVAFDITRSLSAKTPNRAEIRVWNLNPDHRSQLQQLERVYVSLEAGYAAGGTSLLFRGDLRAAMSAREGSHWITTVTSDTGATARKKRLARSFAPGATVAQVLQEAAKAMGLRIGNAQLAAATAQIRSSGASQFYNGYSVAGALGEEVDRLARSAGLEWSVQDDELQFLPRGGALEQTAILLTPGTGLVGSPERGNRGLTECRALLVPDLYPGRRVEIRSTHVTGVFRVESAKYSGGTADREWYADLQLKLEDRTQR